MALSLRQLLRQLWREHASPSRLGAAVAVGILVGCTPFFGLHLWIGLALALLLRLNKLAVFLGSQISIPPLAPLLGYSSIQLGSLIVQGQPTHLALTDFSLARLPSLLGTFLLYWFIGGLLVGGLLALPALFLVTAIARRRRRPAAQVASDRAWRESVRQVVQLFAAAPRGHRGYVATKLRMDPVYRHLCAAIDGAEAVVDLGTGLALFPLLLAVRGGPRQIVGVDWDEAKLASARRAAGEHPALTLVQGDVREVEIPPADAVVLVDVLHYYDLASQGRLLHRAARALRPGGQLLVRETERRRRALITRGVERLAVGLGWNRGPGLTYRTAAELRSELEALGLAVTVEGASSWLHRGNILLRGCRPPAPAAAPLPAGRAPAAPDMPDDP